MATSQIVIEGNLTKDPVLRFTKNGDGVASFTVAQTERRQQNGQWGDGDTIFFECSLFGHAADAVVDQLRKGQRVLVKGRLGRSEREWQGKSFVDFTVRVESVGVVVRPQPKSVQDWGAPGGGGAPF